MGTSLTLTEMRTMREADLLREITQQYRAIARLTHAVKSGAEKGSHLLKREKIHLSRMLTVLSQLRAKQSPSTIPAFASAQPVQSKVEAAGKSVSSAS